MDARYHKGKAKRSEVWIVQSAERFTATHLQSYSLCTLFRNTGNVFHENRVFSMCAYQVERREMWTKLKTRKYYLVTCKKTKMNQNIYANLRVDDESADPGTANLRRKAGKKLKEIERLKTKTNLTADEIDKINAEKKWQSILHIFEPVKPEKSEKKRKRKPKQKPPKKEEPKQPHFVHIELPRVFVKPFRPPTIQDEFEELLRINSNVDKTFRQLSIKYHPDKNLHKKQWAETMQKELGGVRDAYAKRQ